MIDGDEAKIHSDNSNFESDSMRPLFFSFFWGDAGGLFLLITSKMLTIKAPFLGWKAIKQHSPDWTRWGHCCVTAIPSAFVEIYQFSHCIGSLGFPLCCFRLTFTCDEQISQLLPVTQMNESLVPGVGWVCVRIWISLNAGWLTELLQN